MEESLCELNCEPDSLECMGNGALLEIAIANPSIIGSIPRRQVGDIYFHMLDRFYLEVRSGDTNEENTEGDEEPPVRRRKNSKTILWYVIVGTQPDTDYYEKMTVGRRVFHTMKFENPRERTYDSYCQSIDGMMDMAELMLSLFIPKTFYIRFNGSAYSVNDVILWAAAQNFYKLTFFHFSTVNEETMKLMVEHLHAEKELFIQTAPSPFEFTTLRKFNMKNLRWYGPTPWFTLQNLKDSQCETLNFSGSQFKFEECNAFLSSWLESEECTAKEVNLRHKDDAVHRRDLIFKDLEVISYETLIKEKEVDEGKVLVVQSYQEKKYSGENAKYIRRKDGTTAAVFVDVTTFLLLVLQEHNVTIVKESKRPIYDWFARPIR